ncbi:hypothetical protein T440DRAFT_466661 [Plenodomus tracheiphilus IPT5]|uniref:Uncharacterized protein n=1 Tax=Plenodomus tracheiphilus IPT5 TaxID=1408161 RepID=A0A6A7BDG1_9PLEO|nr:hypothetical protein T440DRAFT_466661 [Plenodomus tracheiphilus IPT5]
MCVTQRKAGKLGKKHDRLELAPTWRTRLALALVCGSCLNIIGSSVSAPRDLTCIDPLIRHN